MVKSELRKSIVNIKGSSQQRLCANIEGSRYAISDTNIKKPNLADEKAEELKPALAKLLGSDALSKLRKSKAERNRSSAVRWKVEDLNPDRADDLSGRSRSKITMSKVNSSSSRRVAAMAKVSGPTQTMLCSDKLKPGRRRSNTKSAKSKRAELRKKGKKSKCRRSKANIKGSAQAMPKVEEEKPHLAGCCDSNKGPKCNKSMVKTAKSMLMRPLTNKKLSKVQQSSVKRVGPRFTIPRQLKAKPA